MITPTRVKLSAPHELLSYVPALVGMRPVDSVVLVAFRDQSTCGAMRLDLAAFTQGPAMDTAVDAALNAVTRIPRLTGLVAVIYTAALFADIGRIPHETLARSLTQRIENRGLEVIDMLCVAADAWGGYLDDSCEGLELSLLADPDTLPYGHVLDAADELSLPDVDSDDRESFIHATAALARVHDEGDQPDEERRTNPFVPDAPVRLHESAEFTTALASYVDDGVAVLDAELALIAQLIAEPSLRDVIAYCWAWGAETGTHLWRRVFTPEQFTMESIDDPWMYAFAGRVEVRPGAQRLRNAITLLKRMCALQQPDDRAPGLTLISWCYWALGLSTFSGAWQRDAIAADGTYGLAIIMGMIHDAGSIPDWAFYDPDDLHEPSAAPRAPGATESAA